MKKIFCAVLIAAASFTLGRFSVKNPSVSDPKTFYREALRAYAKTNMTEKMDVVFNPDAIPIELDFSNPETDKLLENTIYKGMDLADFLALESSSYLKLDGLRAEINLWDATGGFCTVTRFYLGYHFTFQNDKLVNWQKRSRESGFYL